MTEIEEERERERERESESVAGEELILPQGIQRVFYIFIDKYLSYIKGIL